MRQTKQLLTAIELYLAGKATAAQRQMVNDWYHSFDDERVTVQTEDADYERLADARLRIRIAESTGTVVSNPEEVKTVRLWPRIAVAAAVVAAIVVGVYFFTAPKGDRYAEFISASQDIAPGKNGATITLASGKVIQLSDAKSGVVVGHALKYSDGSDVRYSSGSSRIESGTGSTSGSLMGSQRSKGPVGVHSLTPAELQGADGKAQQLTATTAKGQTYQFTLPDGTKVWLNADSKLEFPSNFASSRTRNVKLSGEGYFEVAKDKAHPFMVNFKTLTLTVLGTHFNVNAYENEKIAKATLLEGSIKVEKLFLKPDQQAVFDDHKRLSLETLENAEKEIAWKDGYFRFYDEKIENIMKKLERWYDIEVVYEGKMTSEGFTGKVSRNKNISQVLMILEKTKDVHFKIEGRRVTVID